VLRTRPAVQDQGPLSKGQEIKVVLCAQAVSDNEHVATPHCMAQLHPVQVTKRQPWPTVRIGGPVARGCLEPVLDVLAIVRNALVDVVLGGIEARRVVLLERALGRPTGHCILELSHCDWRNRRGRVQVGLVRVPVALGGVAAEHLQPILGWWWFVKG